MRYPATFEGTLRAPWPMRVALIGGGLVIMGAPTWDILTDPATGLVHTGFSWFWSALIVVFLVFGGCVTSLGFASVRLGSQGLVFQNSLLGPVTEVAYGHILSAEADLFGTQVRLRDGRTPILVAVPKCDLLPMSARLCRADLLVDYLLHRSVGP